jgi:hypothetical protein
MRDTRISINPSTWFPVSEAGWILVIFLLTGIGYFLIIDWFIGEPDETQAEEEQTIEEEEPTHFHYKGESFLIPDDYPWHKSFYDEHDFFEDQLEEMYRGNPSIFDHPDALGPQTNSGKWKPLEPIEDPYPKPTDGYDLTDFLGVPVVDHLTYTQVTRTGPNSFEFTGGFWDSGSTRSGVFVYVDPRQSPDGRDEDNPFDPDHIPEPVEPYPDDEDDPINDENDFDEPDYASAETPNFEKLNASITIGRHTQSFETICYSGVCMPQEKVIFIEIPVDKLLDLNQHLRS